MKYGNVKDADGFMPPLPEDNYFLKVSEVRDADRDGNALADKNGDPYVWVIFRVHGHDQKIWHMLYPNPDPEKSSYGPRAAELKSFLSAIECDLEGGDTDDWVNRKCRASVIIGKYEGREKNYIDNFEAIESKSDKDSSFKNDDEDLPF